MARRRRWNEEGRVSNYYGAMRIYSMICLDELGRWYTKIRGPIYINSIR